MAAPLQRDRNTGSLLSRHKQTGQSWWSSPEKSQITLHCTGKLWWVVSLGCHVSWKTWKIINPCFMENTWKRREEVKELEKLESSWFLLPLLLHLCSLSISEKHWGATHLCFQGPTWCHAANQTCTSTVWDEAEVLADYVNVSFIKIRISAEEQLANNLEVIYNKSQDDYPRIILHLHLKVEGTLLPVETFHEK